MRISISLFAKSYWTWQLSRRPSPTPRQASSDPNKQSGWKSRLALKRHGSAVTAAHRACSRQAISFHSLLRPGGCSIMPWTKAPFRASTIQLVSSRHINTMACGTFSGRPSSERTLPSDYRYLFHRLKNHGIASRRLDRARSSQWLWHDR